MSALVIAEVLVADAEWVAGEILRYSRFRPDPRRPVVARTARLCCTRAVELINACVCSQLFTCPVHGERHVGGHD